MLFKPAKLGREGLEKEEMIADKKACRRFGPCGVGKKALYLNSFYIDRRYYLPFSSVTRVFKRVAMSKGGFTGKGLFASIPYLVVEYDDGKQKQCNFKYEEHVDQMLLCISERIPGIPLMSKAAEARVAERERQRAARPHPVLTPAAERTKHKLDECAEYLNRDKHMALELSQSARRKRAFLQSNPAYRWVAMAITALGAAALGYAVYSLLKGNKSFAIYFTLFGLAAIFLFSGMSVLPTARNNRKAIMNRADRAQAAVADYLKDYPNFPVPVRYAHPVVLERMSRIVEEGRAERAEDALEVLKKDLQALNNTVEVDQDEYDEVIAIKALFLNENYQ